MKTIKVGSTQVHIRNDDFFKVKIETPHIKEQQKIAAFLTEVDNKIEQLTKKKQLLVDYKKGVMQQIFSQEIRFKQDDGSDYPDWEVKALGSVITEYKNKSTYNDEHPVMTSSTKGLVFQKDYFGDNRLVDRSNIGFNIIPPNYITYRSRSDNRRFTFNMNSLGTTGIVSSYYPVFKISTGCNKFFIELTKVNVLKFGKYSVGTSQTVLSLNEIKKIKFKLPVQEEQEKIGYFLTEIDTKINQVEKQLAGTKQFKSGLLQQMFV